MRQSATVLKTLVLCCLLAPVPALIAIDCKNPSNGCGRTPAKVSSTTPDSITAATTTPPIFVSHRKPCTDTEIQKVGCLNSGSCAVLLLNQNRTAFCMCPKYYSGARCEELSPEIFDTAQGRVVTAGVAAGVVVFLLLVTIFTAYAVIKIRKKRARSVEVNGRSANGPCRESLLTNCNTMTGYPYDEVPKEYYDRHDQRNSQETDMTCHPYNEVAKEHQDQRNNRETDV